MIARDMMRAALLLCAAVVLCGCADGDWERLTSYGSGDHMRTASLPPEAVRPAPPDAAATSPVTVQEMAQPEEMAQPQPVTQPAPVTGESQSVAGLQPVQQAYAPSPASPMHEVVREPVREDVREPAHTLSGARMAKMAAHCKGVARQRATDGGYMGYGEDLQEKVFNGTYANCMKWETAHAY